jgi:hypothetical protein
MQSARYRLYFRHFFYLLIAVLLLAQSHSVARANPMRALLNAQKLPMEDVVQPLPDAAAPGAKFGAVVVYDSGGFGPGSGPYGSTASAIGDFNRDGHSDVVVVNSCQTYGSCTVGVVSILLGNGDGTFQSPVTYSSGGYIGSAVAIADLKGDGKLDLVVTNRCQSDCSEGSGPGGVSVLLGNGDGTFQPAVSYSSGGYNAEALAIADLSNDGKPDLVISQCFDENCTSGEISVLLGNGDGTFQPPVDYSVSGGSTVIGDVNGDGIPDIVAAGYPAQVLLGNGNGTFQPPVNTPVSGWSIALGDVNGDGKMDLVTTSYTGVTVSLGNGNGTFQTPISYTFPKYWEPDSVAIGDVNGDGKPDLVVTFDCSNLTCVPGYGLVVVMSGNGDGTFNSVFATSSGGHYATSVEIRDVNGNGKPDIVLVNSCGLTEGDKKCSASADGSIGVLLNELTIKTATHVTSSLNPSQVNQSVTFTATVVSNPSVPNGEVVTFYNGATKIGTGTTSNGVASLTTSFSTAGKYTIKASYPGDAFHNASLGTVKQVVQ